MLTQISTLTLRRDKHKNCYCLLEHADYHFLADILKIEFPVQRLACTKNFSRFFSLQRELCGLNKALNESGETIPMMAKEQNKSTSGTCLKYDTFL
uniref:Uncharacterized protein n=1 Tax=Daphnia magna TaxID=35525 RepID=A0A0P6HF64_9CRUS